MRELDTARLNLNDVLCQGPFPLGVMCYTRRNLLGWGWGQGFEMLRNSVTLRVHRLSPGRIPPRRLLARLGRERKRRVLSVSGPCQPAQLAYGTP